MMTTDGSTAALPQTQVAEIVDNILHADDANDDGMIEYSEFVTAMRRNRHR